MIEFIYIQLILVKKIVFSLKIKLIQISEFLYKSLIHLMK